MPPDAPITESLLAETPILLVLVLGVVAMGSLCVWAAMVARWWRGADVLRYEPRDKVPWTSIDLGWVLLLALVTLETVQRVSGIETGVPPEKLSPDTLTRWLLFGGVGNLTFVLVCAMLLALRTGARLPELGIATSIGQFVRDLRLGVMGFFAAFAPVYLIQVMLNVLQQGMGWEPKPHLLQKLLTDAPSSETVVVAVFTAVVVAPIFEEFVFRLVLQGWLERIETAWSQREVARSDGEGRGEDASGEPQGFDPVDLIAAQSASAPDSVGNGESEHPADAEPPAPGISGWPRGTIPIAISSTLFALLHLGHGFDPVPLWVLAVGLGLIYQRTHRILPCVVLHMVFNAFGLAMLWLGS